MSKDGTQLVSGLGMVGVGVYLVNFQPGSVVLGWLLILFGVWIAVSVFPLVRDGLFAFNDWQHLFRGNDDGDDDDNDLADEHDEHDRHD